MKRKIILLGVFGLLFPLNIKALSGDISLTCDKESLQANETTNCTLKGNSDVGVTTIYANLELGTNLELTSISKNENWYGDLELNDPNIELINDNDVPGEFEILSLTIKAKETANNENSTITIKNIQFGIINDDVEATLDIPEIKINFYKAPEIQNKNIITINGTNIELLNDVTEYSIELPYNQTKLKIESNLQEEYTLNDEDLETLQDSELKVGLNKITFRVSTSDDETTYTVNITRKEETKKEQKPNNPNNPKTGNKISNIIISIVLLSSLTGLVVLNKHIKKI
ncbi:MAG: cadherin-like beta sandwich domain-containing protein [Bacilli bacterium]|nr:cadherin-like beta sandwich domain-containing protein [Bacilli bacterium]MBP3921326.1 cadherin-like beta sandwich domain-containing protein [Bacilli bacterium]